MRQKFKLAMLDSHTRKPVTTNALGKLPKDYGHHECAYIPSPEEIAEETAKIRAGWSKNEKARRIAHSKSSPIEIKPVGILSKGYRPSSSGENYHEPMLK